ncbi:MAG: hypothetical protein JWM38_716, partial [Sphingomonas bacterium]|nr:hypothetical protein [Sphingomonas bacterium]
LEFRQALAEHLALHPLPGELSDGELLAALTSVRHLDPTGTG